MKDELDDPLPATCYTLLEIEKILEKKFTSEEKKFFTCCFPKLISSTACNIISDKCILDGCFRYKR